MMFPIKDREDFEKINEVVSLENEVKLLDYKTN